MTKVSVNEPTPLAPTLFETLRDGTVFTWGSGASWYVKHRDMYYGIGHGGVDSGNHLRDIRLRVANEVRIIPEGV